MPREPGKSKKKQATRNENRTGAVSWLHQCPAWPIYEVMLSEKWNEGMNLVTVLVARQSPRSGKIAAAAFLVDLQCMGVKSSFVRICKSPDDYERRLRSSLTKDQPLQPADLHLAAKIVAEGLAFAESLGLSPDPEYVQASPLLAGADPTACSVEVPLGGSDGKPHFMVGPYDNVDDIIAALTNAVGPDGFDITVHQPEEEKPKLSLFDMLRH
jgi:hypothetical protein